MDAKAGEARRASYLIAEPRGRKDVLVILALSGGGSRAAYFSGSVMLKLETVFPNLNILREVDVLSSVSGGSLAAAYYAVSRDPDGAVSMDLPPPQGPLPPTSIAAITGAPTTFEYNAELGQLTVRGPLQAGHREVLDAAFPQSAPAIRQLEDRVADLQTTERVWDAPTVRNLMTRDYLSKWFRHWFFPHNIARYWFTSFTRTDIMADIFADDMFDSGWDGEDLRYGNLPRERPYLIVNATSATDIRRLAQQQGSASREADKVCPWSPPSAYKPFTFTTDDFRGALSRQDLGEFRVGDAVMSSAAFPAVFNYVSLKQGSAEGEFVHVFDGGNYDNLGLTSAATVINCNVDFKRRGCDGANRSTLSADKAIVLLVDSFIDPPGVDPDDRDPRGFVDYFVDTNFMDSFDALLASIREAKLQWFINSYDLTENRASKPVWFCHLSFEGVKDEALRKKLNRIPTSFKIDEKASANIDKAVELLVTPEDPCLAGVQAILLGRTPEPASNRVGATPTPTGSPAPECTPAAR